jgi:acyl-CoA hydrolase/RimJ/RimL family protein N-acetyltransferase
MTHMPDDEALPYIEAYRNKVLTAEHAVRLIKDGQHVFVGTACACPQTLVHALENLESPPSNVELVHFWTMGIVPHDADGKSIIKFRHKSFFVGADIKASVKQGLAEYAPLSISELPNLIELGRLPIDVALIQTSPPDQYGYVSLGISVDVVLAAVKKAKLVIAEINPNMPRTMGSSMLHIDKINQIVLVDTPLIEYQGTTVRYMDPEVSDETVGKIARYISGIIEDGSTMQIGLGRVPSAVLNHLEGRKNLGIHSGLITDSIIPLLEKGILNGSQKTDSVGRITTGFAIGTQKLYSLLDQNPLFNFLPMDEIGNPSVIAAQNKMVSITQAFSVDLTGQICSDQFSSEFIGGIAFQATFLNGAARSKGGKPIVCLTSTSGDNEMSRIQPLLREGDGVSIGRHDVHYVITEFGIAYLHGKSIRERALALIDIAHPKFKPWLFEEGKRLGYVPQDQILKNFGAYEIEEERSITLKNGKTILLRPAITTDAEEIQDLFHQLPSGDVYTRFFHGLRMLSSAEIQRLCNTNPDNEMAFVVIDGSRENDVVIGHACYFIDHSSNLAETAFIVHPEWQGTGLGTALQTRLKEHAMSKNLKGFTAEILTKNQKMIKLAQRCSENTSIEKEEDSIHITMLF